MQAQVLKPPKLVCATRQVNGDIQLYWHQANNPCGGFIKYEIYHSNNKNGPYSVLATINSQAAGSYLHLGADCNNIDNFYYMLSDFNCPGFFPVPSDTLDCDDPAAPLIQYVSVLNGNVEIFWEVSTSPETFAYIIYRDIGGFNPIDTVFGRFNTFYLDVNANADTKPEKYTIAAMDSCGNTGPFSNLPHQTIFMEPDAVICVKEIDLAWNRYVNWPFDSILEHRVYYKINANPYLVDSVLASDKFSYTFTNFTDGDNLCLFVAAVDPSGIFVSRSNEICVNINIVEPAKFLYITNATVTPANELLIEWMPDPGADLVEISVLRSKNDQSYSIIDQINAPKPIPLTMNLIDVSPVAVDGPVYYKIQTTDSCDNDVESGVARTMHLSGRPRPNFENVIRWNPFEIEHGTIDEYRLYRLENGMWNFILSVPPSNSQIIIDDDISNFYQGDGLFCYRVEAWGTLNFPDGSSRSFISSSNEDCINQIPIIHVPNAIIPEGDNRIFKPVISFYKKSSYIMLIFNRWGQKIFESDNIDIGWDGRHNNEIVSQGVYTYLIQVLGVSGKAISRKGTVMVIR